MSEEAEEEGQQQDEGPPNPDQHIPVPLETLGWSDVMKEPKVSFNKHLLCARHVLGLSFISSNLTALVLQGWLTHHPVHCGSERSATCPGSPGLARAGLGLDPWTWVPCAVLMLPQVDTSSELWAPHLQGPVLSHLELRGPYYLPPAQQGHRRDRGVQ